MNDPQGFEAISRREQGLQRRLSAAQMSMIAIGGAIGTGLFMGSAFAIGFAGPSVLLSYAIGALITLLLMGCLAEMTVAHATPARSAPSPSTTSARWPGSRRATPTGRPSSWRWAPRSRRWPCT